LTTGRSFAIGFATEIHLNAEHMTVGGGVDVERTASDHLVRVAKCRKKRIGGLGRMSPVYDAQSAGQSRQRLWSAKGETRARRGGSSCRKSNPDFRLRLGITGWGLFVAGRRVRIGGRNGTGSGKQRRNKQQKWAWHSHSPECLRNSAIGNQRALHLAVRGPAAERDQRDGTDNPAPPTASRAHPYQEAKDRARYLSDPPASGTNTER
jgi:hypothetical protein